MSYMKQLFDRYSSDDEETITNLIPYRHAYDIFMEYFDKLPDDIKPKLHKRLEGLGLW